MVTPDLCELRLGGREKKKGEDNKWDEGKKKKVIRTRDGDPPKTYIPSYIVPYVYNHIWFCLLLPVCTFPRHRWCDRVKAVLIEGLFSLNFQIFLFTQIFVFAYFLFSFFQILECEAFQMFCLLLSFQTLEMFPVFRTKKKRGKKSGKHCSIRTALTAF